MENSIRFYPLKHSINPQDDLNHGKDGYFCSKKTLAWLLTFQWAFSTRYLCLVFCLKIWDQNILTSIMVLISDNFGSSLGFGKIIFKLIIVDIGGKLNFFIIIIIICLGSPWGFWVIDTQSWSGFAYLKILS